MIQKELQKLYKQSIEHCRKVTTRTRDVLHHTLDIPHACLLCKHQNSERICSFCSDQFFTKALYSCSCCALPMPQSALLCGECLKQMPIFERTISAYEYHKPLSTLILDFKTHHDFYVGKALADLMLRHIQGYYQQYHLPLPDLLVPVPLYWQKQWRRGFNQSLFLAKVMGRQLDIPLFTQTKRKTHQSSQKLLNRKQRLNKMEDSFIVPNASSQPLKGQDIAIIDDVMTTGATAQALSKALKTAGAARVSIWVLARTPKNQ